MASRRAVSDGGGNAAGKPVAGGATQNEDRFRSVLGFAALGHFLLHVSDLALYIHSAALRVGVDAHIATDHRFNNHKFLLPLSFLYKPRQT